MLESQRIQSQKFYLLFFTPEPPRPPPPQLPTTCPLLSSIILPVLKLLALLSSSLFRYTIKTPHTMCSFEDFPRESSLKSFLIIFVFPLRNVTSPMEVSMFANLRRGIKNNESLRILAGIFQP